MAAVLNVEVLLEDLPDGVGRRSMIGRQVAGALASRDHVETAGARPVDLLANQRRLVAPGERIDDAFFGRLAREQWTGQRIRLDVDHDDVLARFDRSEAEADAGCGIAGRLDDDVDLRGCEDRAGIVGDKCLAGLEGIVDRGRVNLLGRPADAGEALTGTIGQQIGQRCHVHALGQAYLREEHRAEFTGADLADADRLVVIGALGEHAGEVHRQGFLVYWSVVGGECSTRRGVTQAWVTHLQRERGGADRRMA